MQASLAHELLFLILRRVRVLKMSNKPGAKLVGSLLWEVPATLALLGIIAHAYHAHVAITAGVVVRHAVTREGKWRAIVRTRWARSHGVVSSTVLVGARGEDRASAGVAMRMGVQSLAGSILVVVSITHAIHARRWWQAVERGAVLARSKLGRARGLVVGGSLASPAVVGGGWSVRDGRDATRLWALGAGVEARNLVLSQSLGLLFVGDASSLAGGRVGVVVRGRRSGRPALWLAVAVLAIMSLGVGGKVKLRNSLRRDCVLVCVGRNSIGVIQWAGTCLLTCRIEGRATLLGLGSLRGRV